MSDLISRQEVYNMLHGLGGCDAQDEWSEGWDKAIDTAISELDDISIAYDVDEVVEQLEKMKHPYTSFSEGYGALNEYDYYIDKAITIVKGEVRDD